MAVYKWYITTSTTRTTTINNNNNKYCLSENQKKLVKKVLKGTSEYQAAWITDEVSEDDLDSDEDSEEEVRKLLALEVL